MGVTFHLEIKFQKVHLLQNMTIFQLVSCPFGTPLRMVMCIHMPGLKNQKARHLRPINRVKLKKLAYQSPSSLKFSFKSTLFIKILPFL